jgi:CRISPR-associated endonuclease/helicase Cas3
VIDLLGAVKVYPLQELVEKDVQKKPKVNLNGRTVLLPPAAGGLVDGMLDGASATPVRDVADEWYQDEARTIRRRRRVWDEEEPQDEAMRLVRTIDTRPGAEEDTEGKRLWRWFVRPRSADDEGSRFVTREQQEQKLEDHQTAAAECARKFADALALAEPERSAVSFAAAHHDDGKDRPLWQATIGNHDASKVLAKSGHRRPPEIRTSYRHEFGSLLDVLGDEGFSKLSEAARQLALHLIAAHHGRARPHFPLQEAFDPGHLEQSAGVMAEEVTRRFAHLQRKYGRWGLAYLESLVRAADALASQPPGGKAS